MREILFRGKRLDNGEWVEGFLVKHPSAVQIGDCSPWYISVPPMDPDDNGGLYNVDPETVGQFIGLTDKDGKRIFDGDILRADNGKQSSVSVVKFGDYLPEMFYKMLDMWAPGRRHLLAHGFYAKSIGKGEEMILFQSPCTTIIGNIYDNADLLEV